MRWEYRSIVLSAEAHDLKTKAYLQSLWPGWEPPRFTPQALIPKLNDYGANGWELVHIQPVYLDDDANVLIHGGPNQPDDPITGMIKAKARIPSSSGSEPTRYTHSYFCTFKRQVDSEPTAAGYASRQDDTASAGGAG